MSNLAALILAAGQGKRMCSDLPKVLHPCAELPLLCHVVRLAMQRGCAPIVVVVSPSNAALIEETLTRHFPNAGLRYGVQEKPQGTGDAARAGLAALGEFSGQVLILYGDVPLMQASTIDKLRAVAETAPLAVLSAVVADPKGFGRIVRNAQNGLRAVVEDRDADATQRAIHEINAGVYCVDHALLKQALSQLRNDNVQGEYYLTDIVQFATEAGNAEAVPVDDIDDVRGVNSRTELIMAERIVCRRLISEHAARGVTFHDPDGTFVGVDVQIGRDVDIGFGVQLAGHTVIKDGVSIEGPTIIRDCTIGTGSRVHGFSHLEQAVLEEKVSVGPFARLRPLAYLEEGARVGNFVEIKKSRMRRGSKANHLAYVGDADIGAGANLGAGTITCNYDGFGKHVTQVGEGAFVGSNSTLVAPVRIGAGAFVAAGSAITQDVAADALAFGRAVQVNREGYAKSLRERLGARAKLNKKER